MERLEGSWIEEKKIRKIKNRVTDEEFDTKLRDHYGHFDDLVQSFQIIELDLYHKGILMGISGDSEILAKKKAALLLRITKRQSINSQ